jgi:hypothetical protein
VDNIAGRVTGEANSSGQLDGPSGGPIECRLIGMGVGTPTSAFDILLERFEAALHGR